MLSLWLVTILFPQSFVAAAILRSRTVGTFRNQTFRQSMKNTGDAQYTGVMHIGGQKLNAVIDTGSFELVVLSKKCNYCGKKAHLFDDQASSSFEVTNFTTDHKYGSGTTDSYEAYDKVAVGPLEATRQGFWEVYDANMPILSYGTFQAIFGVGPPTTAVKFAQEDVDDVHKELAQYQRKGMSATKEMQATVKHYDDLLNHAQNSVSVVKNLGIQTMSICLGKESGSQGYIVWNDPAPKNYPDMFVEVDVVGEYYWSAKMTGAKLRGRQLPNGKKFQSEHLGCSKHKCSAVIDSGTTLIVAPPEAVAKVEATLDQFVAAGGSCDDLSEFPEFEFELGGKPFTLPPEAYIGKVSGSFDAAASRYLPHVFRRRQQGKRWGDCESLLMSMDMESKDGPTWILGMAFFRKYYSSFTFTEKEGVPQATKMAFALADSSCEPASAKELEQGMLIADRATRQRSRLQVDASKIRVPSLASRVDRAMDKAGKLAVGKPTMRI